MRLAKSIVLVLFILSFPALAPGQSTTGGSENFVDVTDPPTYTVTGNTYNITSGVVTRASGTRNFPAWIADGRLLVDGSLYTVDTRDSDTQVTLDNTGVTGHSGITIAWGAEPATPWDGNDDTAAIQACFDAAATVTRGTIYFPAGDGDAWESAAEFNDGYEISSTIDVGEGTRGLRIMGQGLGNNNGSHAEARLTWTGAGAGPIMAFQDCSGLVLDGLSFDGDGVAGAGDPITKLVTISNENDAQNDTAFNIAIRNCHFYDAPTLVELSSYNTIGNANYLWSNCLFEGEHDGDAKDEYGIRNLHNQGLMHTFIQCEWRNTNICIQLDDGGRFQTYGGGLGSCWQFFRRMTGSQNTAGISVRDLFINNGGSQRTILYESEQDGTGRHWGPITFEGIHTGAAWPNTNHVTVSSYSGTSVVLNSSLALRVGDEIAFYNSADLDTRLQITEITAKTSGTQYTVANTPTFTPDANTRAAHGTALFKLTGGERLAVRDCWWTRDAIRGKRLCRLETGTYASPSQPFVHFDMNSGLAATDPTELATIYLDMDTTSGGQGYFRFSDCDNLTSATQGVPMSFTNVPNHTVTGQPGVNDDGNLENNANGPIGYAVGAMVYDTSNDKAYALLDATDGSAVWVETTAAGGGGSSLPVSDVTSIVEDNNDGTKELRFEVSNITTGNVRVINIPDSNVTLHKNNYNAVSAPGVNEDTNSGYSAGSLWFNTSTDKAYLCVDATVGAADWRQITLPVDSTTPIVHKDGDTSAAFTFNANSLQGGQQKTITLSVGPGNLIIDYDNYIGTAAPTVNNDTTEGYGVGSMWHDTTNDNSYICLDATDGAAVWKEVTATAGVGTITVNVTNTNPTVNDDTDNYSVGDRWVNTVTEEEFVLIDATDGAALWKSTTRTAPISF